MKVLLKLLNLIRFILILIVCIVLLIACIGTGIIMAHKYENQEYPFETSAESDMSLMLTSAKSVEIVGSSTGNYLSNWTFQDFSGAIEVTGSITEDVTTASYWIIPKSSNSDQVTVHLSTTEGILITNNSSETAFLRQSLAPTALPYNGNPVTFSAYIGTLDNPELVYNSYIFSGPNPLQTTVTESSINTSYLSVSRVPNSVILFDIVVPANSELRVFAVKAEKGFSSTLANDVIIEPEADPTYDEGYDDGYGEGYDNGYDSGYAAGLITAKLGVLAGSTVTDLTALATGVSFDPSAPSFISDTVDFLPQVSTITTYFNQNNISDKRWSITLQFKTSFIWSNRSAEKDSPIYIPDNNSVQYWLLGTDGNLYKAGAEENYTGTPYKPLYSENAQGVTVKAIQIEYPGLTGVTAKLFVNNNGVYNAGYEYGYNQGYEQGEWDAAEPNYRDGYDAGYNAGLSASAAEMTGWDTVKGALTTVFDALKIKVFGIFSIGDIVGITFVFGVVMFFLKFIRG